MIAKCLIFLFILISSQSAFADLRRGLVGWWKFDEISGNAIDSSGQGSTGTPNGTTLTPNCVRGGCRLFNGNHEYISATSSSLYDFTDNFSVSVWVYLLVAPGNNSRGFIGRVASANDHGWVLASYSGLFRFLNSAVWDVDAPAVNIWYNIVGVMVNGTAKIYVNTVQGTDGTPTVISPGAMNVVIGRYYSDFDDFYPVAYIDDVRIYNRALTSQEVLDLYASGIQIKNAKINNAKVNF